MVFLLSTIKAILMKKILKYGLLVVGFLIVYVVYSNYPRLNIISGYSAKNMSSSIFVANRTLEVTDSQDNNFSPINLADDSVNLETRSAQASVYGFMSRKAIYREGLGSVLVVDGYDEDENYLKPKRNKSDNGFPFPYGDGAQKDTTFNTVNYKSLKSVVDKSFDAKNESLKRTRAVLVIYKDQIIAEKYAEGFDKNSKMLGWSMTKSITSAIIGILEKQGKVSRGQSNLFEDWKNDERSKITLNNLLQMNSGLEWVEDYNTMSDVTKMLFLEKDMTRTQLNKPLVGEPGNSWNYSSGTTNLLSGFIRSQFESHQQYLDFWYKELIDKIGMNSMLIETDLSGNYVGSSYGWATTRDWAKFGLLYLHNGIWNEEQILSEDWVDYSVTATNNSNNGYGAQFWLNKGGRYPSAPKDMFSCNGYQGQRVFIIPSKDMVIVRMGLTENSNFDFDSFLKGILNSIR